MAENSDIQSTHHTFNPWIGCTKVSTVCDFCHAEAKNDFRKWNKNGWGPHANRKLTSAANWRNPIKWNKALEDTGRRERVFRASLADVFDNHLNIDSSWRDDL